MFDPGGVFRRHPNSVHLTWGLKVLASYFTSFRTHSNIKGHRFREIPRLLTKGPTEMRELFATASQKNSFNFADSEDTP